MSTKRLEILEESLKKKKTFFDEKLQNHINTVKKANGQPLNDKRNGQTTFNKWEKQNDALQNLQKSIAKTENAIEIEKDKIIECEAVKNRLPQCILDMLEEGKLTQWRKYPNTFFVNNVEKARIIWNSKKKIVAHKYIKQITDKEQWKLFVSTYNELYKALK